MPAKAPVYAYPAVPDIAAGDDGHGIIFNTGHNFPSVRPELVEGSER